MAASDTSLYKRWQRTRDAQAFTELVRRHSGMVFNACLRVLGDASAAEEVTQECFIALMKASTPINTSVGGWLYAVATRRALDTLKGDHRRKQREHRYAEQTPLLAEPEWKDLQRYADEAILGLPEDVRIPIVLRFLEGRTHRDIAKETAVSRSTVKRRIERGIEIIRIDFEKRGITTGALFLTTSLGAIPTQAAPQSLFAELGRSALVSKWVAILSTPAAPALKVGATLGGSILVKKMTLAICFIAIAIGSIVTVSQVNRGGSDLADLDEQANADLGEQRSSELITPESVSADTPLKTIPETNQSTVQDEPTSSELRKFPDAGNGDLIIFGTVVNQVDQPVSDALIQSTGQGRELTLRTDENGEFRLEGLADGLYRLEVQGDFHTPQRLSGVVPSDDPLTIVLEGSAVLEGRIIAAATGVAVPNFEIMSTLGRQGSLDRTSLASLSEQYDSRGRFHLDNISLGETTIIVKAHGYEIAYLPMILDHAVTYTGLEIVLEEGLVVEGTVWDTEGEPVPNAFVFAGASPLPSELGTLGGGANPSIQIDAVTNAEGQFSIDTIGPDDLTISAYQPRRGQGQSSFTHSPSGPTTVDVVLSSNTTGGVEGTVSVGGEPSGVSNVWATPVGGEGAMLQQVQTDQKGIFYLDGLPLGTLSVIATYPKQTGGSTRRFMGDVEVLAGQTTQLNIDFEESSAIVEGSVTLASAAPVGGNIVLRIVGEQGTEMYFGSFGKAGTFLFEDVVPGAGNLHLNAKFQSTDRSKNIDLTVAEDERKFMEIDLAGGLSVSGLITGLTSIEHGMVVALRGTLEIKELDENSIMSLEPYLEGTGHVILGAGFTIEGLTPGSYTLVAIVTKSTGPDEFKDMRWTATPIEITDDEPVSVDFDMTETE